MWQRAKHVAYLWLVQQTTVTPFAAAAPPAGLATSTPIAATSKTPVGKVGALQSNLDAPAEGEGRRQANFLAAQLGAPRVAEACGFLRSEVWDRLH